MSNKDTIVQVKGSTEKTELAINSLKAEGKSLGQEPVSETIKEIPTKIDSTLLKSTKTKDMCIKLSGKKDNVKNALTEIKEKVTSELGNEPHYELMQGGKELGANEK